MTTNILIVEKPVTTFLQVAQAGIMAASLASTIIASGVVLGRTTAGSGGIEQIAYGATGLSMLQAANAAAGRTVLGLGTMAVEPAANYALVGQQFYLGTTLLAINRGSSAQALTGITSIDGNAATVTLNANLTGEATSAGTNAVTLTNSAVIGKVLTGYTSGAGTVAATDSILQAIQKLNANDATNANLTGPITSAGNATAVAAQTGTGSVFVMQASPTLTTPNIGAATALSITLSGNISAPAWTTTGLRIKGVAATLTDTTSTGTVAAAYTDAFGGNTIAATSATVFTNYVTAFFSDPIAGANVTMTNRWALGAASLRVGTSNQLTVSNAGVATFNATPLFGIDNTYDIGTTALRPRDVFVGRTLMVGVTGSSYAADIQGAAIGASFAGIDIRDSAAERFRVGYINTSAPVAGLVPAQLLFAIVESSGGVILATRGTVQAGIAFYTSPDAGVTGLVERLKIAGSGFVGIGATAPAASLDMTVSVTAASWTTNGIGLRLRGNTYTDSSTAASGTAATNHIHAIAAPTLAATALTVTTTTAATLYIAGAPVAGTNMTITNPFALQVAAGQSAFADGTAALPSICFGGQKTTGFFRGAGLTVHSANGGGQVRLTQNNTFGAITLSDSAGVTTFDIYDAGVIVLQSSAIKNINLTPGTNILQLINANLAQDFRVYAGNGGFMSNVKTVTESLTIAAAATTVGATSIPAGAILLGVSVRVTTVIPTAATFTVTTTVGATALNTAAVSTAATSTDAGTAAGASYRAAATTVTITPNLTPGAATGVVRIQYFYLQVTPATS